MSLDMCIERILTYPDHLAKPLLADDDNDLVHRW